MAKTNPLAEGVVGRELVKYFDEQNDLTESGFGLDRRIPVGAECLSIHPHVENNYDQVQYRITFADGSVSDWLVSFESADSSVVVAAEQFNEVL